MTEALHAEAALKLLREEEFDLMLLDLGLPDVDGITFCRRLRSDWRLPIVMLTARSDGYDKVMGLEVGADDYITKPFALPELLARIRAHLRRTREYGIDALERQQKTVGPLVVDEGLHDATVEEKPVGLTDKEFDLLWLLASHAGQALNKDWIFEQVWGYDSELGIKILPVYIRRLRQKIERDPDRPVLLHTVRGYGYRLAAEEPDEAAK
ncbi:MAG: response regulator transcription factor [Armatimonadetes bacterium]|nr:response regulator transcription factor [Armatimonadota bacterium]